MHLSKAQIDLYHRRALSPIELLAVDDHVQVCDDCRIELARGEPIVGAFAAWMRVAGEAAEDPALSSGHRHREKRLSARSMRAILKAAVVLVLLVLTVPFCRAMARRLLGGSRRRRAATVQPAGRSRTQYGNGD